MASDGLLLTLQRIVTSTIFRLVYRVFTGIQGIYWELNGTADQLRAARLPQNYKRSAQVLNVLWFHKFCLLQNVDFIDFLCTHNRFEDPQYIIDNEDVTLMTINDENAVFCESKRKGVRLWSSDCSPFMRLSQMVHHDKLIRVPLSVLHEMAEKLGDPDAKIIFMCNTARCGSTLVTQLLEATGRCVTICEPDSPNLIAMRYGQHGDSAQLRQLARDVIRLECKPYKSFQPPPLAYALKLTSASAPAIEILHELFPRDPCLFVYRDVVRVAKSMYRISFPLPSLYLLYRLGALSGTLVKKSLEQMGYSGEAYNVRLESGLTFGVLLSCVTGQTYMKLRKKGFPISAARYEDLVAKPLQSCQRILEACGLPVDLAPLAAEGLKKDSQRNSPIARSSVSNCPEPEVTPEVKEYLNKIIAKFGMPLIGEKGILEGTVTYMEE